MSIAYVKGKKKPWIARIYVATVDGKVKLANKSFSKESEAKAYQAQYNNFKKNTVDRSVSDKVLFSFVFDNYIEKACIGKKDNTIKAYRQTFNKWVKPHLGAFQVGNINHLTISRYFALIRSNGASDYMINYVHIILFEVFKFASNSLERYIIQNPLEGMPRPNLKYDPTSSIKFWTKEEAKKVLNAAMGSDYYLIFTIMINTGIRVSEMSALTSSSVDLAKNTLQINGQVSLYTPRAGEEVFNSCHYYIGQTKNRSSRSIPLNKNASAAFRLAMEKNNGNYLLFTQSNKSNQKSLIIKRGPKTQIVKTDILSTRVLGNAIKKYSEIAKVKNIGPHGLRHSFAANFLMNGGDIFTLSRILGHKNITSTQIYSHLTASYLKSAMNIVEFGG